VEGNVTGTGVRFHLGSEDLARVRVGAGVGPLTEALFSLDALVLEQGDPRLAPWRTRVAGEAAASAGVLANAAWEVDVVAADQDDAAAGLELSPLGPGPAPGAGWQVRTASLSPDTREALDAYHRVAVRPHWRAIAGGLESAAARLIRLAGEGGVEAMLSSLHPGIEWRPPTLQIAGPMPIAEHELQGGGLVLVPSFFCRLGLVAAPTDPPGPHVLFVPVTPERWPLAAGDPRSNLSALLGRTRAAVLRAVGRAACTTSELAERCGISMSSASEHATVLREAGLIRTDRRRSAVVHSLTSTGELLLGGSPRGR
jgi:hypothetical protein